MMGLLGGGHIGGSIIPLRPLGDGTRSSRNWAQHIFNIMTEFPKRHARKYSYRAGLTSYRGSRLVLINPRPNRVVLRGQRGQIIKISPQVLQATEKQQGNQKNERQKVLTIKKHRRKVLMKSKTTYRRGQTIIMVPWDRMQDDGHPL
jgi:hypothetical protein